MFPFWNCRPITVKWTLLAVSSLPGLSQIASFAQNNSIWQRRDTQMSSSDYETGIKLIIIIASNTIWSIIIMAITK